MKKIYPVLAMMLFALAVPTTKAQIPNNGFENWIDKGVYLNPEGWWTTNDSVKTGSFYPVTRSIDHYPENVGQYSMRLENNVALYPDWSSLGITWTGDFSGNDNPVFPVQGHPNSLWGYYKFFPQNGDTMDIHVRLYLNGVDISGGAFKTADSAADWTAFSLSLSPYTMADSARIFLSSCYDNDEPIPHGNSVLYIDNLSFDSLITTAIPEVGEGPDISIYPNPAGEQLHLVMKSNPGKPVVLKLVNVMGQEVLAGDFSGSESSLTLDVSALPTGVYFLRVSTTEKMLCDRKILVRK